MTDTQTPAQTATAPVYSVPQERRSSPPSPVRSRRSCTRDAAKVVSAGVSSALPVYIERANGAILVDVDGNQFIDFGAGIGVTTVGHTDDARRRRPPPTSCSDVIHTLFTITPYEEYVRVAELLAEHTPGDFAKKSVLVNSGAEAVENGVKIARKYTGRRGVAVLDHAYHGRTNLTMAMNFKAHALRDRLRPVRRRRVPRPELLPATTTASRAPRPRPAPSRYLEKVVGASRPRVPRRRAHPGRGRLHGARRRLPPRAAGVVHRATASSSSPTRSRAAWPAPARYFASEHFGLVPDLVLSRQGHRGRPAARRGHRPRRDHGCLPARAASAARSAATRSRAPRRSPSSSSIERERPARRGRAHRGDAQAPRCSSAAAASTTSSARSAATAR